MNFPDINVVFSFCVPGHIFENRSRNLLLSDKEFIFSDRGLDVLNLVLNRFLEGLARDLIDIVIARKEELYRDNFLDVRRRAHFTEEAFT